MKSENTTQNPEVNCLPLIVAFVLGICAVILVQRVADDAQQYSPDPIVQAVIGKGSIVGTEALDLPPVKSTDFTIFEHEGRTYIRQFIEGPRYAVLKTEEEGKVIEVEIWDREGFRSIFYEVDIDAMKRYQDGHPSKPSAEQDEEANAGNAPE